MQLSLLEAEPQPPPKRAGSWLATPFSKQEQRDAGRLYAENIKLIRWLGHRMTRRFPMMRREDVYSCIDVAFLKTFRAWQPEKGKLSTILERFASGECSHFVRDHNFSVSAPGHVRDLGRRARKLLDLGMPAAQVCRDLGITTDKLREALVATSGVDHETRDWAMHECPRPTPWDVLTD
jgi:DNA-directed RNA polymerase specialized sigma subunit